MTERFPGMNPYLEDPYFWHGFHNSFVVYLAGMLNEILPGGYVASVEQRLAIFPEDQIRYADLSVTRRPKSQSPGTNGGVAVQERGLPTAIYGALSEEIYEWTVEIRSIAKRENRVVTIIELLSPANKAPWSEGRKEYLQKQRELVHSDANLMEIDLLRHGAHTVAVPMKGLPPREDWDYIVSLHRVTERFQYPYWLNRLSQPLPEVRVPLLPKDDDVLLDLQAVFQRTYVASRYAEQIDSSVPLPANPWADPKT
jgi:hypothetical protein